jgi:serine protease Do
VVKPSVVRIHVVSIVHTGGRAEKHESAGSGVIITADGHVVTNHHVAARATRLVCTLADKREIEAESPPRKGGPTRRRSSVTPRG